MQPAINDIFEPTLLVLVSTISSFLFTPLSIWIARKLKIIDYPNRSSHTIHHREVPRAGGIAIVLTWLPIVLLKRLWNSVDFWEIFIPFLIIIAFGLLDDRNGMTAPVKLLGQIIAATLLIIFGKRIMFLESPTFFIQIGPKLAEIIDISLTYLWIIGITNSINMIDGIDGLANGMCKIISCFFMIITVLSNQMYLTNPSAVIFGFTMGFSFFNDNPAKAFLGDSGAQGLGFLLSIIAIDYHPIAISQSSTWFAPVLFFSIPIFDTTLVTLSRIRQGIPFYKANLDHTFHRLIKIGWDKNKAATIMHLAQFVFCLVAVCSLYLPPRSSNIIFLIWLLIFIFMLWLFRKIRNINMMG